MGYPLGRVAVLKRRNKRGARGARGTQRQRQRATRIGKRVSLSLRTRNCRGEGGDGGAKPKRVGITRTPKRSVCTAVQSTQYGENLERTPVKRFFWSTYSGNERNEPSRGQERKEERREEKRREGQKLRPSGAAPTDRCGFPRGRGNEAPRRVHSSTPTTRQWPLLDALKCLPRRTYD